jgi:hypothetical protein
MSKLRHPSRSQVLRDYLDLSAGHGPVAGAVDDRHGGMKAATYPKNRVGCRFHALGAAGDAVVVGWAGLKCSE